MWWGVTVILTFNVSPNTECKCRRRRCHFWMGKSASLVMWKRLDLDRQLQGCSADWRTSHCSVTLLRPAPPTKSLHSPYACLALAFHFLANGQLSSTAPLNQSTKLPALALLCSNQIDQSIISFFRSHSKRPWLSIRRVLRCMTLSLSNVCLTDENYYRPTLADLLPRAEGKGMPVCN